MGHADGSVMQTFEYLKQNSLEGLKTIWPTPSLIAWKNHLTLITYLGLWWFGIFNPAIVYDHLGEIYSALVTGSLVFCVFLYIKGHLAPSSSDSGSSGNVIIDFYWGMELYPRIGKHFDIKVFTNCRFWYDVLGSFGFNILHQTVYEKNRI
ncbi:7-dehydrocholesterol reductase-like [Dioscorea cayenensis subsp. rotundata]|uniref:7-dehydrocholesterol reductase n=1 Tax=Dioscorea cayennensis subsp. rotundata TaxID=55577 RepID=A0AB40ALK0_DIOCR|nr:7-dehydrocholesterol reductase-like [Dioscorea cayenensis subsp. rotundata]